MAGQGIREALLATASPPTRVRESMRRAYIIYFAALVLFGTNGIVASSIDLPSYEIVLARTLIGSLFLAGAFVLSRKKLQFFRVGRQAWYLVVSGAAMGASWMLLFEAYRLVGVSVSTLLYYCGPVIVMALAPLAFGERIGRAMAVGFVAVLLGMVCVNGFSVPTGDSAWGFACGILSAVLYAVMVIANKKATGVTGVENSLWQLVFACVVVAVFTAFNHTGELSIPAQSILPMLFLGIVNTGLGCYWYFSSIKRLSAQTVSIFGYLEPLSALAFSALLLGEHLSVVQVFGAVLILGGAAFGELFGGKKTSSDTPSEDEAIG
ncbi:DMT family transporter [Raoultibacter massiliensis]|uniref:DMT family transporter n=1 Tax=Raoultibacter massiliensis TaxID=1852371 RepID=UPI001FE3C2D9|nr:DMT family transporter [Raoultibacter massiliensis]